MYIYIYTINFIPLNSNHIRLTFKFPDMTQGKVAKLLNSFGVLLAGMIAVFLQSGSFKAFGVLFDDIVEEYKTSYMYAGWVLTFKDSVSFIVGKSENYNLFTIY